MELLSNVMLKSDPYNHSCVCASFPVLVCPYNTCVLIATLPTCCSLV